ncbi:MAG TPA: hypothetical protein QF901_03550 [Gammaproteobacteria bacterium]|jgi:hypothetical protein|nr:hypothetical protein [Gammaproteobacteria bacterium]
MSAYGGLFLLDTGSVTPDSIRGRYDGDDARPPAQLVGRFRVVDYDGNPLDIRHSVLRAALLVGLIFGAMAIGRWNIEGRDLLDRSGVRAL